MQHREFVCNVLNGVDVGTAAQVAGLTEEAGLAYFSDIMRTVQEWLLMHGQLLLTDVSLSGAHANRLYIYQTIDAIDEWVSREREICSLIVTRNTAALKIKLESGEISRDQLGKITDKLIGEMPQFIDHGRNYSNVREFYADEKAFMRNHVDELADAVGRMPSWTEPKRFKRIDIQFKRP